MSNHPWLCANYCQCYEGENYTSGCKNSGPKFILRKLQGHFCNCQSIAKMFSTYSYQIIDWCWTTMFARGRFISNRIWKSIRLQIASANLKVQKITGCRQFDWKELEHYYSSFVNGLLFFSPGANQPTKLQCLSNMNNSI